MRNRGRISALSAGVHTTTLLVMVDRVKAFSPGWADFTCMMECTPEVGHYHSVYPVVETDMCVHL